MGNFGKYYSDSDMSSGSVAGHDLFDDIKEALSVDSVVARKLTLISSSNISVDINNLGVYSTLHQDTDGDYKLSLDTNDVLVNSLKVKETSASPIFLAIVFN